MEVNLCVCVLVSSYACREEPEEMDSELRYLVHVLEVLCWRFESDGSAHCQHRESGIA